ncbi:hypothetical protein D3C81_2125280 [compost metagenome]
MIVLCVGDSRFERLFHCFSDPLARESEISKCRIYFLAADKCRDKIKLLRADAKRTGDGFRLVILKLAGSLGLAHLLLPL